MRNKQKDIRNAIRMLDELSSLSTYDRPVERAVFKKYRQDYAETTCKGPIHSRETDLQTIIDLLDENGMYMCLIGGQFISTRNCKLIMEQMFDDHPHLYFITDRLVKQAQECRDNGAL